ncbi:MAG: hypothetical protein ACTSXA_12805 [Candidatus Heimdallarchaeota archaeon]
MNQSEAITKAEKHAKELKYETQHMDVQVTKYETPWNPWLRKEYDDEYSSKRKKLLEGKEYWAVYFSIKKRKDISHFGGDICVFIDIETGEIITNVRGK